MKHITIVVVLAAVSLCLFGRTALADDWTGPTTINVEMKGGKIITLKKGSEWWQGLKAPKGWQKKRRLKTDEGELMVPMEKAKSITFLRNADYEGAKTANWIVEIEMKSGSKYKGKFTCPGVCGNNNDDIFQIIRTYDGIKKVTFVR